MAHCIIYGTIPYEKFIAVTKKKITTFIGGNLFEQGEIVIVTKKDDNNFEVRGLDYGSIEISRKQLGEQFRLELKYDKLVELNYMTSRCLKEIRGDNDAN